MRICLCLKENGINIFMLIDSQRDRNKAQHTPYGKILDVMIRVQEAHLTLKLHVWTQVNVTSCDCAHMLNKSIKSHVKLTCGYKIIESARHSGAVGHVATLQLQSPWFYPELELPSVCWFACFSCIHVGFLYVLWFPTISQKHGESVTLNCPDCEWVYSLCPTHHGDIPHLAPGVSGIGSGSTTTLTRIERLLNIND